MLTSNYILIWVIKMSLLYFEWNKLKAGIQGTLDSLQSIYDSEARLWSCDCHVTWVPSCDYHVTSYHVTNLDILHSPARDVICTVQQMKLVFGQELHHYSIDVLQIQIIFSISSTSYNLCSATWDPLLQSLSELSPLHAYVYFMHAHMHVHMNTGMYTRMHVHTHAHTHTFSGTRNTWYVSGMCFFSFGSVARASCTSLSWQCLQADNGTRQFTKQFTKYRSTNNRIFWPWRPLSAVRLSVCYRLVGLQQLHSLYITTTWIAQEFCLLFQVFYVIVNCRAQYYKCCYQAEGDLTTSSPTAIWNHSLLCAAVAVWASLPNMEIPISDQYWVS